MSPFDIKMLPFLLLLIVISILAGAEIYDTLTAEHVCVDGKRYQQMSNSSRVVLKQVLVNGTYVPCRDTN